ncbi:MAG: Wzz/FepE/Etk N-terminal domain-containing protein, partial [Bacteroidota bacterium]
MDLFYILQILWKRKWMLLLVGASTTVLTYFLMSFVPPEFKSETVITTGIIERKAIELERENPFRQQFQVSSQFSNFVTRLQSRTSIRRLAYDLLQHDLEALLANEAPFNLPDEEEWTFEPTAAKATLKLIADNDVQVKPNRAVEPKIRKVADAFGYDFKSLSEQLNVYRDGSTDYLKLIFTANSAELAVFAVNTLAENFVRYYNEDRVAQERFSVEFYADLAFDKKQEVDSLSTLIAQYKRNRRIIDLKESGSS